MIFDDKFFIANKIKLARKNLNMTQAQLAELIDISVQQMSRIEVGTYIPSLPTFLKIVKVLNLTLDDFGINACVNNNDLRSNLIKKISLMNNVELKCCENSINTMQENLKIIKANLI